MYKIKPEEWLVKLGMGTLLILALLLQSEEPVELERINGVAMVTGRILNLPDHIVGQPLPMTENMAAGETNYLAA